MTQGGVVSWRTNSFALDCRQAEALPPNWTPPKFVSAEKLIILTDGTCGSTCASFTKIPQEAGKATFVGAGAIWNEEMDVSSFAGGFVCQPLYLAFIAQNSSGPAFPQFLTNQAWQFGWATWYSERLPSRQTQFTEQGPQYRQPFWSFPHPSINPEVTTAAVSVLYDDVIDSMIQALAASVTQIEPTSSNSDSSTCSTLTKTEANVLVAFLSIFAIFSFSVGGYLIYLKIYQSSVPSTYVYGKVEAENIDQPFLRGMGGRKV